MDGIQSGALGFAAPVRHWRQLLNALPIPVLSFPLAYLLLLEAESFGLDADSPKLLTQAIFGFGVLAFEWVWLQGIRNPGQGWWRAWLCWGPAFWLYALVSMSLFLSGGSLEVFQDTIIRLFGVAKTTDGKIWMEPTLLTTTIALAFNVLWIWVRIRLVFWPTDIAMAGRLRSPARAWGMTRGRVLQILALWLTIALMAVLPGLCIYFVGWVFLDEEVFAIVLFASVLYLDAALVAAYLDAYRTCVDSEATGAAPEQIAPIPPTPRPRR